MCAIVRTRHRGGCARRPSLLWDYNRVWIVTVGFPVTGQCVRLHFIKHSIENRAFDSIMSSRGISEKVL